MQRLAVCLGGLLASTPALAQSPDAPPAFALGLPLQCQLGETCWIANYIDVKSGPGVQDFQCGARSYDGHDGVDFAIRDRGVMMSGVPVVASASGVIKNVRDGMDDTGLLIPGAKSGLKGKECGNGVVVDHADGWQTQYCHLRRGSAVVRPGETVATGTILGAVGMSGWAEFPHVHLAVRHNGAEQDPFTGLATEAECGQTGAALWRNDLNLGYEPAALYHAGFTDGPPDMERIRAGLPGGNPLNRQSPALVLWVEILGVLQGDSVTLSIISPDGSPLLTQEQTVDKTQARRYIFIGKRRTMASWTAGQYLGRIELVRDGKGDTAWRGNIERTVTLR